MGLGVSIRFGVRTPPADQIFSTKKSPAPWAGPDPGQKFPKSQISRQGQHEIREPQNAKQKNATGKEQNHKAFNATREKTEMLRMRDKATPGDAVNSIRTSVRDRTLSVESSSFRYG